MSAEQESSGPLRLLKSPDGTGAAIVALFEPTERRLVKREVLARVSHAQQALREAQAEAEAILARAEDEAEALREQGRAEGRAEGVAQLMSELSRARKAYDGAMHEAERDMLELAFGIAQRVIGQTLARDPELIASVVAQALERVRGKRQIVVIVHPEDRASVEGARAAMAQRLDGASLYIEEDPRVSRGGCLIETEAGRVDARLEVQLDTLRQALEGGHGQ